MSRIPRPTVFIGSSSEGLRFAEAVQSSLEPKADPILWDQDVFKPTQGTLEALERASSSFDFAIFVMSPDDLRTSRGAEGTVPRDNVIFELGLFIGAIGHERVFFLSPDTGVKLPTDLLGITALKYYPDRSDGNSLAAVRTACNRIRNQMETVGRIRSEEGARALVSFWHSISDRRADNCDLPALLRRVERRVFLSSIEMRFLVEHCSLELRGALQREVRVEIAIAANVEPYYPIYAKRQSRTDYIDRFNETMDLFSNFVERLAPAHRQHFGLYGTTFPITHSIGIYDDDIYISEIGPFFKSSRSPSYKVSYPTSSYNLFMEEAIDILNDSQPLFGSSDFTLGSE